MPASPVSRVLVLFAVFALACGTAADPAGVPDSGPERPSKPPTPPDPTTPDPATPSDPAQPPTVPAEIARATTPASVKAKAEVALFYERTGVRDLYAIDARALVPAWAAAVDGDPASVRDDDLLSGVRCVGGQDRACAIGLDLHESVPVRAVRISSAAGPRWRDFKNHARIKRLRLHTDAGAIEVELPDGHSARWVVLAQGVPTRTLGLEAVDGHDAAKGPFFFGEVEVYAAIGPARGPIAIDPARVHYRFDSERWADRAGSFEIRPSHVETLSDDGTVRRHATATAVYGQPGDRVLLFETVRERSCDAASGGSYVVLDTQRRLWLDVGRLGALGGEVWRRGDGRGFVVGDFDDPERWPKGVVLEGEKLARVRVNKKGLAGGSPGGQLAAWKMDPTPARSGVAGEVGAPPAGCAGASDDQVARLPEPLRTQPGGAERWITCALANAGELMVHASPTCPGPWALAVLDGAGAVSTRKQGPEDGRSPRLAPRAGGGFVVELDRAGGDDSDLFTVGADGTVTEAIPGAGHVLRPPAACGCGNAERSP